MPALPAGKPAPAISLHSVDGRELSLADALKKGPVLAVFFKVSCPVCQFTFPFLERMYETYGGEKISFWGVSQDDASATGRFLSDYGVKFPALIDERGYPVSNQYGITHVPSLFLIAPDGKIRVSSAGFVKADLEKIAAEAVGAAGKAATPLFKPGEKVPEYKPG
jgi:peroxiredoxin